MEAPFGSIYIVAFGRTIGLASLKVEMIFEFWRITWPNPTTTEIKFALIFSHV